MLGAGGAAACAVALPQVLVRANGARGQVLSDLPELALERQGNRVSGSLAAGPCRVEVAGREVELLCYQGAFPGPVMRLRQDDILNLTFANRLDAPSNLHTHGLSVSPEGNGDNPFLRVGAGERQAYKFDLRDDPRNCGLFWYHPHYHGTDARQLAGGLAGPIVVEGESDPGPLLGDHDERILVLKDLRLGAGGLGRHLPGDWTMGFEGEHLLVNGLAEPVLQARERRLRLRIVNASNARYWRLSLPGAEGVNLVALDGHVTERPLPVAQIGLAPGQRADAVVDLPAGGEIEMLDLPVPRMTGRGRRPRRVMTLRPPAGRRAAPDVLPAGLSALDEPRPVAAEREVVFSLFYICGQAYGGPEDVLFRPAWGTRERWEIRNVDTMDHPFHLHSWPFRVEAVEGRPVAGRPLRDTLNLRPGARAEITIDFDGVAGRSMFHCHIAEHSAKGMMAVMEVQG